MIFMDQIVIACETLRDELQSAMRSAGARYDILWIESGLHNYPKKLQSRLQETLDGVTGYGRVLLCFGTCGNAVLDLKTGPFELVLPRVDDCITLLLGSLSARKNINAEHSAYYLTEGWLRGERNLWVEYTYCVDKYGEEQAMDVAKILFGNYRKLALLDAGINDIPEFLQSTKIIADTLGLEQIVLPASTKYIEELLLGPWPPDRFIITQPFSRISDSDLILFEGSGVQ
jgi:hypothetical protein